MVRSEINRYESVRIENICKNYFGINLSVGEIVLDSAPSGKYSNTTLFSAEDGQIYALCMSDKALTLADVKSIMRSMGITAETFIAPGNDASYFSRYGYAIYKSVFPARKPTSDQDISFYKTLAPYSPALVKVSKINGIIRKYNTNWHQWQNALELNYGKVQVG